MPEVWPSATAIGALGATATKSGRIQVGELSTLVTDFLLGALTLLLGVILLTRPGVPARLWGWAFVASAFAAFVGGVWHGFHQVLADTVQFWMWKAVMILSGLFAILAVIGSVRASCPTRVGYAVLAVLFAGAVAYGFAIVGHDDFRYVLLFSALAMVLLVAIHAAALRRRDAASPWILAGVAISVLGAAAYATGFSPFGWLNGSDVFHIIQMAAMYLMFRGALAFGVTPRRA